MNYEVVKLEEKIVVGVSAVTSNADPMMGAIIGGLWNDLFVNGKIAAIKNRVNEYTIGLYSDYVEDNYCVTTGCEVSKDENQELTKKIIPGGTYAKFSVHGPMQQIVAETWKEIWSTDLNRSYTGDFEEYTNSSMEEADINIYIALKEA